MTKDFVEAVEKAFRAPHAIDIGGQKHLVVPDGFMRENVEQPAPMPATLVVHTLTGVVDYVVENRDKLKLEELVVQVVDATTVVVHGALTERWQQRATYLRANHRGPGGFKFGTFMPLEEAVIGLNVHFTDGGHRDTLLKLLSNVRGGCVRTAEDDGFSQAVTVKQDVGVAAVEIKNPFTLAPFRTFSELAQPASPFVLRLRDGEPLPTVAIYEADAGAWMLQAISAAATFLREKLAAKGVVVIA